MTKLSFIVLTVIGFIVGSVSQAFAAFSIDMTIPSLNSTYYKAIASGTTQYVINADYTKNGTSPNMVVSELLAGNTMRLKVLLPPGTKYANIRGESNDWIGATGKAPVVGVLNQDVTGACPSSSDGVSYSCDGVSLSPPAGGLSMPLYAGTELTQPKYAYFILHNPSTSTFTFSSLSLSIQITNATAYNAWLNARPWAGTGGTGGTGSTDGIGDTVTVTPIVVPQCDLTDANLLSTLDGTLSLTLPRVKYLGGGFADMRINLKQVFDPKSPNRYLFKPTNIQFLTCGQTLSK
jgi:hypothetical protein